MRSRQLAATGGLRRRSEPDPQKRAPAKQIVTAYGIARRGRPATEAGHPHGLIEPAQTYDPDKYHAFVDYWW